MLPTSGRCNSEPHPSHALRHAGGVVFCWHCGGYSVKKRSKLLSGPCPGRTKNPWVGLRRLREGRHPVSNACLT
eukprot:4120028-Karenia_brevis.AAC.1